MDWDATVATFTAIGSIVAVVSFLVPWAAKQFKSDIINQQARIEALITGQINALLAQVVDVRQSQREINDRIEVLEKAYANLRVEMHTNFVNKSDFSEIRTDIKDLRIEVKNLIECARHKA
jgi:ribosomal protein L29